MAKAISEIKVKFTDETAFDTPAKGKPYKISTGQGFYLFITKTGKKSWKYDYTIFGKRQTIMLGYFPDMNLEQAKKWKIFYRSQVHRGVDPRFAKSLVRDLIKYKKILPEIIEHKTYGKILVIKNNAGNIILKIEDFWKDNKTGKIYYFTEPLTMVKKIYYTIDDLNKIIKSDD